MKDKILDAIELANQFEKEIAFNLEAIAYALAIKFLDQKDLNTVKEEIRMTMLGKMLVEDGKFEGKVEMAINLLDLLDDVTIAQRSGLDLDYVKQLRQENEK